MTQCVHDSCVHCNVIVRLENAKKQKISVIFVEGTDFLPKKKDAKKNRSFEGACWMSLVKCCLILSLKVQGLIHPRLSQWLTQWWKYLGNLGTEAKHFILRDAMTIMIDEWCWYDKACFNVVSRFHDKGFLRESIFGHVSVQCVKVTLKLGRKG